jgi:hypothetical protein
MKFLSLTILGFALSATAVSATDGLNLSTKPLSVKEQKAYQYEFDRDEQCQGYYWGVKRLGIENPCKKEEDVAQVQAMNVLNEYVVYFDFDEASIREQDKSVLQCGTVRKSGEKCF